MIERARANAERADIAERRPTYVVGSVAALPFPVGSFDLVVSSLSERASCRSTATSPIRSTASRARPSTS